MMIYPVRAHDFKYELNKDMNFSAAHFLPDPNTGKCHRVHGHTYHVNLTIVGDELDDSGLLIDFALLKKVVHDKFDHTLLNDHPEFKDNAPSSEKMAEIIHGLITEYMNSLQRPVHCIQVFLRETPTSYVVYRHEVQR